jgi:hypothetical protein
MPLPAAVILAQTTDDWPGRSSTIAQTETRKMTCNRPPTRILLIPTLLFCLTSVRPAAASQQAEVATTVAFTEGPTVDREGNVHFKDMKTLFVTAGKTLYKIRTEVAGLAR